MGVLATPADNRQAQTEAHDDVGGERLGVRGYLSYLLLACPDSIDQAARCFDDWF